MDYRGRQKESREQKLTLEETEKSMHGFAISTSQQLTFQEFHIPLELIQVMYLTYNFAFS